ncbi:putative ATP-binding component of a transport system, partial [Escherichia coli PA28]
MESKSVDT